MVRHDLSIEIIVDAHAFVDAPLELSEELAVGAADVEHTVALADIRPRFPDAPALQQPIERLHPISPRCLLSPSTLKKKLASMI